MVKFGSSDFKSEITLVEARQVVLRVVTIAYLCGVNVTSNASNGLTVIGLPRLTEDLDLHPSLAFWPLNGEQLIILRALQGLAAALHFSTSVALVTLGQPQLLGFSASLILGGILVDTIGWRSGWYLCGGMTLLLFAVGWWSLPKPHSLSATSKWQNIKTRVDWVGGLLASSSMSLLTYFLALLLAVSLSLVTAVLFVFWMHFRVKNGQVALIPNELWKNASFTSICITVALSFAVLNSLDLVTSLYFQDIEHLSALEAAIRMLPSTVVGLALNISTGLVVHKIRANYLILMPFSVDVLFTVGLIVITEVFPDEKQAIAGAVFNTAGQLGNTMGLAAMQVISTWVTKHERAKSAAQALMEGYRATFWTMLALLLTCTIVGAAGLRQAGRIGSKHD
ncbi:major facilitator superfamily domain-containing protein [Fusarium redolens]|uniref:Major facilitator superfamily domain-containing protein n=1 Tax=Fusarium redolens TaxID=48865 RepID=A0A9P9JQI6_FUSRE|nr:major facilitator superfamily domain-containing protein [Fusarium redolens]KAH7233967.1 major facilitator superfamily domain-containing protein [Fusarium redolens]